MTTESKTKTDFRMPTASKWSAPRAVADGGGGTIIATAEVAAPPERVFRALTTDEVERWWGHPDYYRQTGWKADLRVCGQWSVTVRFADGGTNGGSGEFAELDAPRKIVMTRKFDKHPLQGTRETTITYRLEPIATGTRVTVRDRASSVGARRVTGTRNTGSAASGGSRLTWRPPARRPSGSATIRADRCQSI